MESLIEMYIQALCSMDEDDFTKDIIKPLFEAMGYHRVDFNGGAYERGRDLIAQKRNPPSKDMYIIYVQSKKIGNIQNVQESAKLSQLLHQLRQCSSGELRDIEGNKVKPNEVYLACPERISPRLIEELGTQFFDMPVKVYPYDGPRIIEDINIYKPDLLELLTSFESSVASDLGVEQSNKELMSALKSRTDHCIKDFYSDLSFFVGSFDSNLLFHLDVRFKNDKLVIVEENWAASKRELQLISEKHGIDLINEDIDVLEHEFKVKKKEFESSHNKDLIKNYLFLENKINEESIKINDGIRSFSNILNKPQMLVKKLSADEMADIEDIVYALDNNDFTSCYGEIEKNINNLKNINSAYYKDINDIFSLIKDCNKYLVEKNCLKLNIIEQPTFNVTLKCEELIQKLKVYKARYFEDVKLINSGSIGVGGLKKFLSETEETLSLISKLRAKEFVLSNNIVFNSDRNIEDRVSISPHEVLYTGHDIAIYGGAGVGKTTTLSAYVDRMKYIGTRNVIYIPLNRLVEHIKKIPNEEVLGKDFLFMIILLSKNISPTMEYIEKARQSLTDNLTLILDGLDEIYSTIPNILSSIALFKSDYPDVQLIVSSRDCVSYLNDIDFLGITLLPFTKDQLNHFIRGWFNNNEMGEDLIRVIERRALFEFIETPLLATITCELVDKGINAPSNENEIYSERLRLLTGEYDIHKNIERQKQKGELLRKCAIRIAYKMHNKGVRLISKSDMLDILFSSFAEIYSKQLMTDCLNELIDPCNLLIVDPITSLYSFGHFRFQEHLASEELKSNRSVNLCELVINDWWRGALCLYAQDNEFSNLFEDVYNMYGNISRAKITLEAMINNGPQDKRIGLRQLLQNYAKADRMDSIVFDNGYDDYDF